MELRDLEIFAQVAREGSVTRASEILGMTQPGVSQHLARLEEELGGDLFDRVGRTVTLNDFGRQVLGRARKLMDEAEAIKGIRAAEVCPVGTLSLGLTDSSTLTIIPTALCEFKELYPGVHIELDVHDSSQIEHGVLHGHYDLGVVTQAQRVHPLLAEEVLYYDRIDALVAKDHPLAKRKRIIMEELAKWPLLVYPRHSRTRQVIDEGFHGAGIVPREIIDVYFNSAAVKLAETGIGVALLSEAFIANEVPKHRCVQIRIAGDPFTRAISAVLRRDRELTEAARIFYEKIKNA